MCILVGKGQHATARVLDDYDLSGAEQLLRDHDAPERFFGTTASVADDVGVAERDSEC